MREIKELLIYLAGAACLVIGIVVGGSWLFSSYQSRFPVEPMAHAASGTGEAGLASANAASTRHPVWIAPTAKYIYAPPPKVTIKPEPAQAAMPSAARSMAKRPARQERTATSRVHRQARQAYGSAGSSSSLLILPLQHQAPQ